MTDYPLRRFRRRRHPGFGPRFSGRRRRRRPSLDRFRRALGGRATGRDHASELRGGSAPRRRPRATPSRRSSIAATWTGSTSSDVTPSSSTRPTGAAGDPRARGRVSEPPRSWSIARRSSPARLSQFAHLVDTTGTDPGTRGYLYRIRQEDVWAAPFEDADGLIASLRSVLPRRFDHLEDWIRDQWRRAHRFRLYTHEDGYVVLQAASEV